MGPRRNTPIRSFAGRIQYVVGVARKDYRELLTDGRYLISSIPSLGTSINIDTLAKEGRSNRSCCFTSSRSLTPRSKCVFFFFFVDAKSSVVRYGRVQNTSDDGIKVTLRLRMNRMSPPYLKLFRLTIKAFENFMSCIALTAFYPSQI